MKAETQVAEIVAYVARDSPSVAVKVNAAMFEAFGLLAGYPQLGHSRSDMTRRPLKFWSVHSYLVAYDPATRPLEIVAVSRGARQAGERLG